MSRLIDWKSVCLVCLRKGENRSIFERDGDSNVTADKIMKCADIFIEKDSNQLNNICLQCLDNLNVTYKFHHNYEQSDSIIKALLSTNHQEFQIRDLWKTTPLSGTKQKESAPKEIFHIEECTHWNEINIKHEIIENDVFDDTDNLPCIDLGVSIDTEAKLVQKNPAKPSFQGSGFELNDVKAYASNKLKQDANDGISRRLKNESKATIENSCDKPSCKPIYKKALKICEICNRSFTDQHKLDIHMRRHNNERPFSCDRCDKAYVSCTFLRRHMKVHTGEKPYECKYCDRRFAEKSNRINHERTHTGEKPFVCPTCGKSFAYSHVLTKHRRIHTKFVCQECGKGFDKKKILEAHVVLHMIRDKLDTSSEHNQNITPETEILKIECSNTNEINIKQEIVDNDGCDNDPDDPDNQTKSVVEDRTSACFPSSAIELNDANTNESNKTKQEANNQILRRLRGQSPSLTGVSCASSSLNSACKRPLKTCEICNRSFNSQHNLDIHMRRHNGERPFSCDHCDKAFVNAGDLRRHMKVHTGEKPYGCQYCDRRFAEKSHRKAHERMHTGERPFVCPTCGKSFTYAHVLSDHRQIHTDLKKFMCDECGKGFHKRALLEKHIRCHPSRDKLVKSSEHKQRNVLEKEIFHLEECTKSNEINIKHEMKLIEKEIN